MYEHCIAHVLTAEEKVWLSDTHMFSMQKVRKLAFTVNEYKMAGIRKNSSVPKTLESSLNELLPPALEVAHALFTIKGHHTYTQYHFS